MALGERRNYHYAVALGFEFLAENSFSVGHWQAALTYAAHDREIGEKIGSLARVAWADISCAFAYQALGELAEALNAVERCVALAVRIGDRRLTIFARCRRATIHIDLGDDEAAQIDLEFALASADEVRQQQVYGWAYTALFYAYLQREDWEHALQIIERSAKFEHRPRRGIAERADRVARDAVRDLAEQIEIGRLAVTIGNAPADLLEPARSLAAWRALTARLVGEELHDPP